MSLPVYESAHVAKGLALLLQQWRSSPKLMGILATYLRQFQTLENVTWDVINSRMLDTAVGAQLDMLGDLVGEARRGRSDIDYRAAVKLRIRVNRSQGTAEDVIDVARQGGGVTPLYRQYPNFTWEIELLNPAAPYTVAQMLYQTKAAGSNGYLLYTNWPGTADVMRWNSVAAPIAGNVWGYHLGTATEKWVAAVHIEAGLRNNVVIPLPMTVGSVSPALSFRALAGATVVITGTGLQSGAVVTINGVPCTGVVMSGGGTTLTGTTGALSDGSFDVVVLNPDGGSGTLAAAYQVIEANTALVSDVYVADGSKIGTWTDQSGHGNDYVSTGAGAGASYNATGINGHPSFTFDTVAKNVTKSSYSGPSAAEVFIVQKCAATGVAHGTVNMSTDVTTGFIPFSDGNIYDGTGSTVRKAAGPPGITITAGHLYQVKSVASSWSCSYNTNAAVFSTGTNTVGWPSTMVVGSNTAAAAMGEIGAVVIFGRALSTLEHNTVRNFLMAKFSIP